MVLIGSSDFGLPETFDDLIVCSIHTDAAYERSSVRVPRLFDEKSVQALHEPAAASEDKRHVYPDAVLSGNARAVRKKRI